MNAKPAVLVAGASAGIGTAYAERFARQGHDLVLVGHDRPALDDLAVRLRRETGVAVDVMAADLSVPEDLAAVEARLGDDRRIGVLVNAADGFTGRRAESAGNLISFTVAALTRLAAAIAPRLVRHGAGAIVNVGTVTAPAGATGPAVQGGTGTFVLFVTQGLQLTLAPKGVHVQAVLHPVGTSDPRDISGDAVDALVDAALAGFDRGDAVTIAPPAGTDQHYLGAA